MLSFLFRRPVSVLMVFVSLIILGGLALVNLPISLLPQADIPRVIIKVNYPNYSSEIIEKNVIRPLRESMFSLSRLNDIESTAYSEKGEIKLYFEQNTSMELAYLEVNEKIDQSLARLPKDLKRPQVIRINTSDIPVVRLQVAAKNASDQHAEISELSEKILKRRLEAIEGVSVIDLNGLQRKAIYVVPDQARMQALSITEEDIKNSIVQNNQELGAVPVREGPYRYFLKIVSRLKTAQDISGVPIIKPNSGPLFLGQIAQVIDTMEIAQGQHFFNGQRAVVITIHKQSNARMPEVVGQVQETVENFKKEYPDINFAFTQDQSALLEASIGNLRNDLLFGGICAFLVLFMFIGNYKIPFLIGVVLPTSLVTSFLVFYVFGTSINIISLAGLTLGLGMTIDNAIIIFDNINKKRKQGLTLLESCVKGTAEMIPPLLGSTITTQIVFIPLVFLDALAGALSYDQAVAVGSILFTSLLVSFFLLPLLYLLIFKDSSKLPKEDNLLYKKALKLYKLGYDWMFKNRRFAFPALLAIGLGGLGIAFFLKIEGLPYMERKDLLCKIYWDEPLNLEVNRQRVQNILSQFKGQYILNEADIGIKQFLLNNEESQLQEAHLYLLAPNEDQKDWLKQAITEYFRQHWPQSKIYIENAPNTFDLLFRQEKPYLEVRFYNNNPINPLPPSEILAFSDTLRHKHPLLSLQPGLGMQLEPYIHVLLDEKKLEQYQLAPTIALQKIASLLGGNTITDLKDFGQVTPVSFKESPDNFERKLRYGMIKTDSSTSYPVQSLIKYDFIQDYKNITADKLGVYHGITLDYAPRPQVFVGQVNEEIKNKNWLVTYSGQYFDNLEGLRKMSVLFLISLLLLYLILATEFESLRQPLIVIFTLPLGFTGSFLLLALTGQSLNVMSAIGMIVLLGIIDNESILKIDTINRLRKEMPLQEALYKAGEICFKPVLMTSLTNILALSPFLLDSGMGADLQRPFVIAIIGGLSIGTVTSLYFVPLMYYYLTKKENRQVHEPL